MGDMRTVFLLEYHGKAMVCQEGKVLAQDSAHHDRDLERRSLIFLFKH